MPGFNDTEVIAVYPTNPGDAFRVPTVEKGAGFEVHLEAEAGNGLIGPPAVTPYEARIQILDLTQFKLVANTPPANATGQNIGQGQSWDTNDEEFIFNVAAGLALEGGGAAKKGDLLEVFGLVRAGNPQGDPSNDFSYTRSAIVEVI